MKSFIDDIQRKDLRRPGISYYIIDGTSKTYDVRDKIKMWGGYFNKPAKCWQINNPTEEAKSYLIRLGLVLQFARNL